MRKIICLIIAAITISTILPGCIDNNNTNTGLGIIIIPKVSTEDSENPKYAMASYYSSDEIIINTSVPLYELPLSNNDITNYDKVKNTLSLNQDQIDILTKNGFVVIDYGKTDDIISPYKAMKKTYDIPIFITSDTLLHLYHIQFDEILKGIEEREFFDKILNMTYEFFKKFKNDYENTENEVLKEAARRNVAYFAIALSLLQTPTEDYNGTEDIYNIDFTIPSYVEEEVNDELNLIDEHNGFSDSPLFIYREDYSQYVPRGHYTQSEKLKRYFKTFMWYGRISFLLKGGSPYCQSCDFLISKYDSKIQTIQSSLIATSLSEININEETAEDIWNRIYQVTSFFVGTSDDLTPYEYLNSITEVFGNSFNATELTDETKLLNLKMKLAQLRSPEIYGGTGNIIIYKPPGVPFTIEDLNETLDKTKGMRLMGQRFIPDSYMFQQLVFPAVDEYTGTDKPFTLEYTDGGPTRAFPRGLDVMAVLGSNRAYELLENEGDTQYTTYDKQLQKLQTNFSSLNITEWNRNLYFSWIYTLKSLLKEYNNSYPRFMQTNSWLDKQLHTSLSSWAQLRHDTILYAKQSYTPIKYTAIEPQEKEVVGYVEPVPEFYSRILSLTKMTKEGLADLNILSQTETSRLEDLMTIIQRLITISKDELENKELSDEDYEFIRNFGENLDDIVTGVKDQGKETTIIADVHTDTNTNQVLEEGTGYVDLILVAYMVPDGRIILGAGPVFSYYEFKHPMNDRLTDEKWKNMLQNNETPERPIWTDSFISE